MSSTFNFTFGTKAETLERLKNRLRDSTILPLMYFSLEKWRNCKNQIIQELTKRFPKQDVVIRSSTVVEDGGTWSYAGRFKSLLSVDTGDPKKLADSIEEVIDSFEGNGDDQVLVQPNLKDTVMSGVVMTRSLEDGAPYYVVNYDDESGRTDSVTGGSRANKTVLIYRKASSIHVKSERIQRLLQGVHEVEQICGEVPLDIEFAMDSQGVIYLLQVRRINLWRNWRAEVAHEVEKRIPYISQFIAERRIPRAGVVGKDCIFGVMPDWNPAEMIGTTPGKLAISLYRELITKKIWRMARAQMGYRLVPREELLVLLGGRPYIDVRNSFNSFLPAGIPDDIAGLLVDVWLGRLAANPEYHDKVEFEVAQTCYDFGFEETLQSRYPGVLTVKQLDIYRDRLRELTVRALNLREDGTLPQAEECIAQLLTRQKARPLPFAPLLNGSPALAQTIDLLEECQTLGTLPFAVIARHAFMAEAIWRSAVSRGVLTPDRFLLLKRSIKTISSQLTQDFHSVQSGILGEKHFLNHYGHLRPGTYDVRSLRYADRENLFRGAPSRSPEPTPGPFQLTADEKRGLTQLLEQARFAGVTPEALLEYTRRAIAGRELSKFVFTRNLSDAIEYLISWSERLELSRENLAHLSLEEILDSFQCSVNEYPTNHYAQIAEKNRRANEIAQATKIGYLIRDISDLYIVPLHRSLTNFITNRHVHGAIFLLESSSPANLPLRGKIVCVEGADPGFDWIFTQDISGLITKYGGANSHMAIRCTEFGLPAAIGCGEQLFNRILAAGMVDLHCGAKMVSPLFHP